MSASNVKISRNMDVVLSFFLKVPVPGGDPIQVPIKVTSDHLKGLWQGQIELNGHHQHDWLTCSFVAQSIGMGITLCNQTGAEWVVPVHSVLVGHDDPAGNPQRYVIRVSWPFTPMPNQMLLVPAPGPAREDRPVVDVPPTRNVRQLRAFGHVYLDVSERLDEILIVGRNVPMMRCMANMVGATVTSKADDRILTAQLTGITDEDMLSEYVGNLITFFTNLGWGASARYMGEEQDMRLEVSENLTRVSVTFPNNRFTRRVLREEGHDVRSQRTAKNLVVLCNTTAHDAPEVTSEDGDGDYDDRFGTFWGELRNWLDFADVCGMRWTLIGAVPLSN